MKARGKCEIRLRDLTFEGGSRTPRNRGIAEALADCLTREEWPLSPEISKAIRRGRTIEGGGYRGKLNDPQIGFLHMGIIQQFLS